MKRTMAVMLVVLLLFALAGCGVRQKIGEKITEEITEGVIGKIGGEDVDIDLDEGQVNIKGEDGSELNIGGTEWPTGGVAEQIPEFKKGKITTVISSTDSCWIEIKDVHEADFEQYVEALKNAGYENGTNYSDNESRIYSAYKDEKYLATVTYSSNNALVIQVLTSNN